jgi:hypothetical protein
MLIRFFLIVLLKWLVFHRQRVSNIFWGVLFPGRVGILSDRAFSFGGPFFCVYSVHPFSFFLLGIGRYLQLYHYYFCPYYLVFLFPFMFFPQSPKGYFLGMCFCVGLIVTTYIPFFFLTILAFFLFFTFVLWKNFLIF